MAVDWEKAGWERLAEGVGRRRLPGWDATTGLVAGSAGALLLDTGATPAQGAEVAEQTRRLLGGGRSVTHVALSHPHFDHVLGTSAFLGGGAVGVYAAEGAGRVLDGGRAELRADAVRHGVHPAEAEAAVAALVVPDRPVRDELALDLGGRRVVLVALGAGHTGHDLAVLVPGAAGAPAVVFCGDLVEESGDPQAGPDAVPARWPAALDRLLTLGGPEARYVPGHGAVVDAAFVRAQRDALARRFGTG
ncbi:MBL fold metallo-hydrolase [Streptomyces sp. LP05-1]|uniref:MBL fold metallo-hydrolase n=1 Tax=Streptomyces pyxinae TaxID=2970734 RepID=A0ABT2CL60_9ACTN|nr:MBL fold metallo-hydrolase [Streptomyces sp. LP05-1]MCS0638156.1 MBL fold metallo-hydrolase [Streptomyces sp. LP05-1]